HARVIFDQEVQAEFLSAPMWQIQINGIVVLLVGRNHPPGVDVGQPAKAQRHAGNIASLQARVREDSSDRLREKRQRRSKTLQAIERNLFRREDAHVVDRGDRGMRSTQINGNSLHGKPQTYRLARDSTTTATIRMKTPVN